MMASGFARQFCCLGEVHGRSMDAEQSGENDRKAAASTRTGAQCRLMDYPGSI